MGEEIDAHKAVFRINAAPVMGFQVDVGARTTMRFSYPPICGAIAAHSFNETHICMRATDSAHMYDLYLLMRSAFYAVEKNRGRFFANRSAPGFFASSPDFVKSGNGIVRSPSSGMSALFFAMHHCDHVSVYGFSAGLMQRALEKSSVTAARPRVHYYVDNELIDFGTNAHKWGEEADFLVAAHQNQLIYHWDAQQNFDRLR
jgi:hypothetical protein